MIDLDSSFLHNTAHKAIIRFAVVCTPTRLCYCRIMAPSWLVKVVNECIKGLEQVSPYLDNVIVFDSGRTAQVKAICTTFERLRKHNLELSPSKARLGATGADGLVHSTSTAGLCPNTETVSALIILPTAGNPEQLCALLIGVEYYHKFLRESCRRGPVRSPPL